MKTEVRVRGKELLKRYRENEEEVKRIFSKERKVVLAYIFGSSAEGRTNPLSDLDFAVHLDEELSQKKMRNTHTRLLNRLISTLGDEIDLVLMNSADLLMKFNIIKKGKLIHQRSEREKVMIESQIMDLYMDMKPYRERHVDKTLEKIKKEGLKLKKK